MGPANLTSFVEKPNAARTEEMLATGNYLYRDRVPINQQYKRVQR
jgi:mannose-1-phosphate guanylyltransferase